MINLGSSVKPKHWNKSQSVHLTTNLTVNVQRFRLFTFANIIPNFAFDNFTIRLTSDAVQCEGGTMIAGHNFVVYEPSVGHFGRIGMGLASKRDALHLLKGAVVHTDGDMGRILHHQLDGDWIGRRVGRILDLTSDIFVMMCFLDGQLQGRNGRNPLGIFNLLRFWSNAFGNGTAIAVQPSELQESNLFSVWWRLRGPRKCRLMVSIGCRSSVNGTTVADTFGSYRSIDYWSPYTNTKDVEVRLVQFMSVHPIRIWHYLPSQRITFSILWGQCSNQNLNLFFKDNFCATFFPSEHVSFEHCARKVGMERKKKRAAGKKKLTESPLDCSAAPAKPNIVHQ